MQIEYKVPDQHGRMEQLASPVYGYIPTMPVEITQGQVKSPVGDSTGESDSLVQQSYSGNGQWCMHTPGHLGPVKLNFLVDTGCTHPQPVVEGHLRPGESRTLGYYRNDG